MRVVNGLNLWDSPEELLKRQQRARQIGNRMWGHHKPEDKKMWVNRFINLAQGIGNDKWQVVRRLSRIETEGIILNMMRDGFPADDPYDGCVVFRDDNIPPPAAS